MKIRVIIISAAVLIGGLALTLAVFLATGESSKPFDPVAWESFTQDELQANLDSVLASGALPLDQEVEFLSLVFQQIPDEADLLIRKHSQSVINLPRFLSDTALELVRAKNLESGFKILNLAQQLFPQHPDVLGVSGIVALLSGKTERARQLLEEAESWQQNRPIVDFYLGGLLIMSDKTADRTRGKKILIRILTLGDPELSELAGLSLLTNVEIPMIQADIELIYSTLDKAGVFRPENPNLSAEALRILTNRMVAYSPDEALNLADLLLQYPKTTPDDYIGMIRLAQSLGKKSKARGQIDRLEQTPSILSLLDGDIRLERVLTVQQFLEERFEEGLPALHKLTRNPSANAKALQDTFQSILRSTLPNEISQEVLEAYLEMPVDNVSSSISVLTRLVQIAPLREQLWVQYAHEVLWAKNPLLVGDWLTRIGAYRTIITTLEDKIPSLNPDEALVLVNAYLEAKNTVGAQGVLDLPGKQIDSPVRAYLQSRILIQDGNIERASEYWEQSHQEVVGGNRFSLMKNLGFLALDLGQPVNAMQSLFTSFTAGIAFTQEQAGRLMSLTLSYGTLRQSIEVAEYLVKLNPDEPIHRNNLAYFRFLSDEAVEESVDVMRELVEAYPEIHQYRLTLALGLIKSGRTNEANRLLQSTNIDWRKTSPRGLLIYAAVLAATDQGTIAEGLIQNIDLSGFIPEEKALLEAF